MKNGLLKPVKKLKKVEKLLEMRQAVDYKEGLIFVARKDDDPQHIEYIGIAEKCDNNGGGQQRSN